MREIVTDLNQRRSDKRNKRAYSLGNRSCFVQPPLVSVIVVNYNYGRFLLEAVTSVFEQTYSHIECIIVDNASTDDSAEVLVDIERQYPEAIILRRSENGGQSAAAVEGFEASSGKYVVFLDADDLLLPYFIETHIFVHLSLRVAVGFTSSDMLQIVGAQIVTGTYAGFADFTRSGRGKRTDLLRPISESVPDLWPFDNTHAGIGEMIHIIEPCDLSTWVWSPTSGNCFRREALRLFMNNSSLASLRLNTDAYLLPGISALTGSVMIDCPLSAYRLHGANGFSLHAPLNNLINFEKGSSDQGALARKMIIDHLIDNASTFLRKFDSPHKFARIVKALDDKWVLSPSIVPFGESYAARKVIAEWRTVAPVLGALNCIYLLAGLRLGPRQTLQAIFAARPRTRAARTSSSSAV
jgi:glycosyltransferase involved in cell wall biosynthesis